MEVLRDESPRFFMEYSLSLKQKWNMKNRVGRSLSAMFTALAAASCGVSEIGDFEKDEYNGVWTGPSIESPSLGNSVTLVTAFDYPDGYDWVSDPDKGFVKCSLVVYADSRLILKVPVGDRYCVSSDPDTHRMIDGHLYTDYATEHETVIKKDGKPCLSYQGRESVVDMVLKGDSLHTLGQKRNGRGFSYRINGEVVLERDAGYAFGRLTLDGDDVCLAFAEPVNSVEGGLERYYCLREGRVFQTAMREDIRKVWDVIVHDGKVYYLATLTGVFGPAVVSESAIDALPMPYGKEMVAGQFFSAGSTLGTEMVLGSAAGLSSAIWLGNRLLHSFDSGMTVASIWSGEDAVACVVGGISGGSSVFRMGDCLEMPEGYAALGGAPIDVIDGILTIGLSSVSGHRPLIWRDGDVEEIDVNGYICTVSSMPFR